MAEIEPNNQKEEAVHDQEHHQERPHLPLD